MKEGIKKLAYIGFTCLVLLCISCDPYIVLDAKPEYCCPGGKVIIEWKHGRWEKVLLKSKPPIFPPELIAKNGTKKIKPDQDVTIIAEGTKSGKTASKKKEIKVVAASGGQLPLVFVPDCTSGLPVWSSIQLPELWDGQIKITGVTAMNDREVTVSFQGVKATLGPSGSTNAFNGRSPAGDWSCSAELRDDFNGIMHTYEACSEMPPTVGPTGQNYQQPPTIRLYIYYNCP